MSKILLGEKSSGCSDLDFLEVEATLPVEQNVGGPAITDDTCQLGNLYPGTLALDQVPCLGPHSSYRQVMITQE